MTHSMALIHSPAEGGLSQYLSEIRKFPLLTPEEERENANRWYYHQDTKAAHTLVTSHLRLVAKIALGYRGYGLPLGDLIAEGNIGLMQAVKKFDPRKGFRLATYALWWIKASIQEFILRSWSLVKIGTTAAQKKLFFNLKKLKNRMLKYEQSDLHPEQAEEIAKTLDVTPREVYEMNARMGNGGDTSLNAPLSLESESAQWQDFIADERPTAESFLEESQELQAKRHLMKKALCTLKDREKDIFFKRRLADPAQTLEDLSLEYNISRERVRQIESRAMEKITAYIENHSQFKQLQYYPAGFLSPD